MTFLWILIFQLFYSFFWKSVCAKSISMNNNNFTSMKYGLPELTVGYMTTGDYYINITLGTPPQKQQLLIDISGPYTWLLSGAADVQCNKLDSGCLNNGLYYPAESTSSVKIYDITSVESDNDDDDTAQSFHVFKDNWNFTNMKMVYTENVNKSKVTTSINSNVVLTNNSILLKNSSFACIESADEDSAILGLGGGIQLENMQGLNPALINSLMFLEKMKNDGIIPSQSYSLWLGNRTYNYSDGHLVPLENEYEGVLLLGGVDASFYEGSFYRFKMIPYVGSYSNISTVGLPILPMGPIYMSDSSGRKVNMTSEQYLTPVLLDSTTNGLYLPPSAIIQIAIQLGAMYVKSLNRWLVPCDIAKTGAHLDFTFDGLVIEVPLLDLLSTTIDSATSTEMHFSDGSTACSLRLSSNVDIGFNILGRSFIRNSYIAVDMEGYFVAIAKAKTLKNIIPGAITLASNEMSLFSTSTSESVKSLSIQAIISDDIPYATYRSAVTGTHLPIHVTTSANDIPAQFTGIVNSNGLISGAARSFYDTSRTSTTKKSTSPYSFFSLDGSGLESLINATGTTPINRGQKRTVPIFIDPQNNMSVWSNIDFSTWFGIIATSVILLFSLWL